MKYLAAGVVYDSAEALEAATADQLVELNAAQGTNVSFEDYLADSLLTGTIKEL